MNSITSVVEKLRNKDQWYINLLVFIATLVLFYFLTYYSFSPYFTWILTYNLYDGKYYMFFISTNVLYFGESLLKAAIFTATLAFTAILSIKISQTSTIAQIITGSKKKESQPTEIIQRWKTNKKITSAALILQYLTLIILIGITFLIWYSILQQYLTIFLILLRYVVTLIAALGITYLINPLLDDEKMLAQACLSIINGIKEGYEKEGIKKIDLAYFMLYLLLNQALSKNIEELEEFNLEPPLTTLYFALLHNEKETITKAKKITTNLLKAITQQKTQDIIKHLSEIDKKLGDVQKLAKTVEISIHYPSLSIYSLNSSSKLARLKAALPLVASVLSAILIYFVKWVYYSAY
jgi:hypothetical protein